MASIKLAYASSQAFTLTLASLGSSATDGRESTAIDNTTNLYVDALVQIKVKTSASALANDKAVYVYAYGSEDGSTYTDPATGSDAAISLPTPTNMRLIGVIACPAVSTTYESQPMSVATAFGGYLPRKWGIVVRNYTGQNLDATEGSHSYSYTGISYTNA
jgi:hypothetical protein